MYSTRLTYLLAPIGIAAVLAIAAPVAAGQGNARPADRVTSTAAPRLILSLGGARMDPVHGDDYPEGPVVLGSLGFAVTPRLRLEAEVTRRAYTQTTTRDNVFLPFVGVGDGPGRADREVYGRETTDWTVGLNVVGRTPPHMVTVFGGAGAGWHRKQLRNYRTLTNCTSLTGPAGPQNGVCAERDERSLTTDYGLQGLGGVDVDINRRWQVFTALRYEMRRGLGMGSFGFMGGVRIGLR